MQSIESPGSIIGFCGSHPELSDDEASAEYSRELAAHRQALAAEAGLSLEELHQGFSRSIPQQLLRVTGVEVG